MKGMCFILCIVTSFSSLSSHTYNTVIILIHNNTVKMELIPIYILSWKTPKLNLLLNSCVGFLNSFWVYTGYEDSFISGVFLSLLFYLIAYTQNKIFRIQSGKITCNFNETFHHKPHVRPRGVRANYEAFNFSTDSHLQLLHIHGWNIAGTSLFIQHHLSPFTQLLIGRTLKVS